MGTFLSFCIDLCVIVKSIPHALKETLSPYHVYATVLLLGPKLYLMVQRILNDNAQRKMNVQRVCSTLTWSISPLFPPHVYDCPSVDKAIGVAIRIAANEVWEARQFILSHILPGIEVEIADNLFERQV